MFVRSPNFSKYGVSWEEDMLDSRLWWRHFARNDKSCLYTIAGRLGATSVDPCKLTQVSFWKVTVKIKSWMVEGHFNVGNKDYIKISVLDIFKAIKHWTLWNTNVWYSSWYKWISSTTMFHNLKYFINTVTCKGSHCLWTLAGLYPRLCRLK
jgi:hypothetical protein